MQNLSAVGNSISVRSPQRDRPRAVTISEKTPLEAEMEQAEREISAGPTDEELLLAVGVSRPTGIQYFIPALLEENLCDGHEIDA